MTVRAATLSLFHHTQPRAAVNHVPHAVRPMAFGDAWERLRGDARPSSAVGAVHLSAQKDPRVRALGSELAAHVRPGALEASVTDTDTEIEFGADTLVTTVTSRAVVSRPLAEVAPLMDPRGWADHSELWLASYPVVVVGGRVERDERGRPVEDRAQADRRRRGHDYRGVLFESTSWEVNDETLASFDTLLGIEFLNGRFEADAEQSGTFFARDGSAPTPLRFKLKGPGRGAQGAMVVHRFRLYDSLRGQLGYQVLEGGIEVDVGYAYALELGARSTLVEAQKSLRYSDWTPFAADAGPLDPGEVFNYMAPAVAGVWIESLVVEGLVASAR